MVRNEDITSHKFIKHFDIGGALPRVSVACSLDSSVAEGAGRSLRDTWSRRGVETRSKSAGDLRWAGQATGRDQDGH